MAVDDRCDRLATVLGRIENRYLVRRVPAGVEDDEAGRCIEQDGVAVRSAPRLPAARDQLPANGRGGEEKVEHGVSLATRSKQPSALVECRRRSQIQRLLP